MAELDSASANSIEKLCELARQNVLEEGAADTPELVAERKLQKLCIDEVESVVEENYTAYVIGVTKEQADHVGRMSENIGVPPKKYAGRLFDQGLIYNADLGSPVQRERASGLIGFYLMREWEELPATEEEKAEADVADVVRCLTDEFCANYPEDFGEAQVRWFIQDHENPLGFL